VTSLTLGEFHVRHCHPPCVSTSSTEVSGKLSRDGHCKSFFETHLRHANPHLNEQATLHIGKNVRLCWCLRRI